MKRKKNNPKQDLKLKAAQTKNEFFRNLDSLITALTNDPSVFRLIPHKFYDTIYAGKLQQLHITIAPGCSVSKQVYEQIKWDILNYVKNRKLTFTDNGPIVTLDTYFRIGLTFSVFLQAITHTSSEALHLVKNKLQNYFDNYTENAVNDLINKFTLELNRILDVIPFYYNTYNEWMYWLVFDHPVGKDGNPVNYMNFLIKSYRPEVRKIFSEGIMRPAWEVCWTIPGKGVTRLTFSSSQLQLPPGQVNENIPVYIQSHAFVRLYERIDCLFRPFVQANVYYSMKNCKFHKKQSGAYLFDYTYFNKKLGYLVADITCGVLLVHSFLFITHDGTPEGNRLTRLTSLKKYDKKHLNIDRLSVFYASDIADNPEVKQIFISAGCTGLFETDQTVSEDIMNLDHKYAVAEKIISYLREYKKLHEKTGTEITNAPNEIPPAGAGL